MTSTLQGTIRGKTIELTQDPGIEEGQSVEVVVRVIEHPTTRGAGIRASAGAFADDVRFADTMDEIQRARKQAWSHDLPEGLRGGR